jgi:Na+/H+ antiporter NhaD/arsenite permease-like protein
VISAGAFVSLPQQELHHAQLLSCYLIFIASYTVFAFGKFPGFRIDRAGMAVIGAALMIAVGALPPSQALSFIDFSTIVLLFSMMVIVSNLRLAGFFDWTTSAVVRGLRPRHFLPLVIFTSGILSAFFVNDIICLVMAPFVLAVTQRLRMKPVPHLLALATASNIGSSATITGNPQNMIVGSYSHIPYVDFMAHLGPVALAGLFADWAVLHWMYFRKRDREVEIVAAAEAPLRAPRPYPGLRKSLLVMALVLVGFLAGYPPALVAALGAALMLITRVVDPREVYKGIDWGLLVFFTGLFLIVGGAQKAGIVASILELLQHFNLQNTLAFSAAVALLSNIVSNVPAVMLLKSLVPGLANPHLGWLALAMASTLAGNLTITGSVANLIVAESAREAAPITFREYFRVGLPITLVTLALGIGWLTLVG